MTDLLGVQVQEVDWFELGNWRTNQYDLEV